MEPRVLHILDHSIPLHSGYTFRTAAILREQRRLGWETFHLTSPKQVGAKADVEEVDRLKFYRTNGFEPSVKRWPGFNERALMRRLEERLLEVAAGVRPNIIHAHSPVLNAMPIPYIEPEDVSEAVVFLASDAARYITGQQLRIDAGGYVKAMPWTLR